mgnify:FL=1
MSVYLQMTKQNNQGGMNKMCEDKKMMGEHSGSRNNHIRFDNSPKRLTFYESKVNTP